MKRLASAVLALCAFPLAVIASSADIPNATPTGPLVATLVVDSAIHFDGADGKPVTLDKGSYVVMADGGGLRLTGPSGVPVVLTAERAAHEQKLVQPQALIVPVGDDERHIVLLQPDGTRLEAIGSASGVHSRGGLTRPALVSNVALQDATVAAAPTQTLSTVPIAAAPVAVAPAPVTAAPVQSIAIPRQELQKQPYQPPPPLVGWVDLHAHPASYLGFGGKLISGGVDLQSPMPTNTHCQPWQQAGNPVDAIGDDRPAHGGWDFNFQCGNALRPTVVGALEAANHALVTAGPGAQPTFGFPAFNTWPAWNDITHQKMWWEWIKRARDGGQRVMVALAVNNRLLGEALTLPPAGNDAPRDDMASADLQIQEIKNFVSRHLDFMEVALTSADLERIARSNRIAVILGLEIDNIGDFNDRFPNEAVRQASLPAAIPNEVQRLYNQGVRYVLPIHVTDNTFGGTAIYEPVFNVADYRETGHYWIIQCAAPGEGITFQFNTYNNNDVAWLVNALHMNYVPPQSPPISGGCPGHKNALGLTNWGTIAIKEMMRRGMIIDIDHMSQNAANQTLQIAEGIGAPTGYPIVSGHNGVRGVNGANNENNRTAQQLNRIARLHGMFGLGTASAGPNVWSATYQAAMAAMGYPNNGYQNGMIGFGTDLNGVVAGPKPGGPTGVDSGFTLPPSTFAGTPKVWNYNTDGVAHYGLMPEFIYDVRKRPAQGQIVNAITGQDLVDNHLNRSADYFWHMWQQCEAQSRLVQ
jgi:microsomal dipeptidase-like Zn-dependent dipeptidase